MGGNEAALPPEKLPNSANRLGGAAVIENFRISNTNAIMFRENYQ